MEFKDRLDYVRVGRRHTDQWRAPRTPDGHDVSEGDRYVDRAVLHVDPSEIVARITDEFADRGVAEGDACSDAGLTTADACSEPVDVVDGHGIPCIEMRDSVYTTDMARRGATGPMSPAEYLRSGRCSLSIGGDLRLNIAITIQ